MGHRVGPVYHSTVGEIGPESGRDCPELPMFPRGGSALIYKMDVFRVIYYIMDFFFKGGERVSMVLTSYLATGWLMQAGDRRRPHELCENLWAALSHHYYYCHYYCWGEAGPMGEGENPYTSCGLIHLELLISLPGRWRFREGTGFHRSHSSDRPSETRNQSRIPLGAGS